MKSLTKEWVEKAESDHTVARIILEENLRLYDQICFHCQQSAEKYLKALLVEADHPVPKTHDLELLLHRLKPFHPELMKLLRGVSRLTDHAVDSRYPRAKMLKKDALAVLGWEAKIREACRAILKIKPKADRSRVKRP